MLKLVYKHVSEACGAIHGGSSPLDGTKMIIFTIISALLLWLGLGVFSYLWVNKAILLMLIPSNPSFGFLLKVVDTANQNRTSLWIVWFITIILLTTIQIWWLKNHQQKVAKKIWILVVLIELIATLSFPFISNDLYSYLYSGKMLVEYKSNPYTTMPKEFFGRDQWLFFVNNVDNIYYNIGNTPIKYYYGPVFLAYTSIIVKIIGPSRFLGLYLSWKILNWIWFLLTGYVLIKLLKDKGKVMALWFLNPLLQFELLVNNHNDLLMIGLFLGSILLSQKNKIYGFFLFICSILIKFLSIIGAPLLFIKKKYQENIFFIIGILILLLHAIRPLHLWYYSWIYMFLPMVSLKTKTWITIFLAQALMLLNYSSYIMLNRWVATSFLPPMEIIRWFLFILVIIFERGRISKIFLLKYKYFLPK